MRQSEGVDQKSVRLLQALRRVVDYHLFDEFRVLRTDLVQPIEVVFGADLLKVARRDFPALKAKKPFVGCPCS